MAKAAQLYFNVIVESGAPRVSLTATRSIPTIRIELTCLA